MPLRLRLRRAPAVAALAVGAVAALALSGCSAGSPDASGPVTIQFWHAMSGPAATELDALVSQYDAHNDDGVTVESSYQGTYADVQTKYTAAVQSGSTPDLLMMNDISTGFMVDSGQTVPIATLAAGDPSFDASALAPAATSYYGGPDGLQAMPFSISMPVLYLDRALVARAGLDVSAPPRTLDEVATWARAIHDATGAYGMTMNMSDSWMLEQLSASGGQDFCSPDNGRGGAPVDGVSLTTPTQVAFMTELQGLFRDGVVLNPGTDNSTMTSAFTSGGVGMMMTSSGAYTTADPQGTASVVARFPSTSGSSDAGAVIGGNALWVSGEGHSDAQQEAAYRFARWLASTDVQAEWSAATGYLAVDTAAPTTEAGRASLADPNVATMYQQLADDPASTAAAGCVTGAFPSVRSTVISAFDQVVEGADVTSTMSTAEDTAAGQIASYEAAAGR